MMINYFWSNNGWIVAKVYDHINKSEMTLRRLENFEKLKSNSIFSYILDYNIISPKGI